MRGSRPGARLEWLPLETIAYSGCLAASRLRFELAPGAEVIGRDVLALGLPAAGRPFERGRCAQSIELAGSWLERGTIDAADRRLLDSPLGLAGHGVVATLWFCAGSPIAPARRDALLDAARSRSPTATRCAPAPAPPRRSPTRCCCAPSPTASSRRSTCSTPSGASGGARPGRSPPARRASGAPEAAGGGAAQPRPPPAPPSLRRARIVRPRRRGAARRPAPGALHHPAPGTDPMTQRPRLHTSPSAFPNPQRLRLFMHEKGIADRFEEVDLRHGARAASSASWPHLKMNPWGETPTLRARRRQGYLSETAAIVRYLDQSFPGRSIIGRTPLEQGLDTMWENRIWVHVLYRIVTMFHVLHQGLGLRSSS